MPEETKVAVVSVDGDQLAGAFRRVMPFAMAEGREDLAAVYAESHSGVLELTASDGQRMAHLTVNLPFPEGEHLLYIGGIKDFADRHYNGGQVEVKPGDGDPPKLMLMGDVRVIRLNKPYVDYPTLLPDNCPIEAIVDTKSWIKAIRGSGAANVGVIYSQNGCKMISQNKDGETMGCESLPVQMYNGPDMKVAYKAEHFRRALTSCGATATLQVPSPGAATLLEADDFWMLVMPIAVFPRENMLTDLQRQTLGVVEEIIHKVKSGEAPALVMTKGSRIYIDISETITQTEIRIEEPILAETGQKSSTT